MSARMTINAVTKAVIGLLSPARGAPEAGVMGKSYFHYNISLAVIRHRARGKRMLSRIRAACACAAAGGEHRPPLNGKGALRARRIVL